MVQLSLGPVGKFIVWYRSLMPAVKSVLWAALLVLPILGSALVSYYLKLTLDTAAFRRELIVVVVLFVIFAFVQRYIGLRCELLDRSDELQRNALAQTYVALDSIVATYMERLHVAMDTYQRQDSKDGSELVKLLLGSLEHIQTLVNALYEVIQGQFSQAGPLLDEINFEVTFMTKSFQDNEITIYASQNRDHRAPSSLLLRTQNKHLYNGTVTADIYRQHQPTLHIIEDTAKSDYQAVYPGQLDRIKSSIVCPVLSDVALPASSFGTHYEVGVAVGYGLSAILLIPNGEPTSYIMEGLAVHNSVDTIRYGSRQDLAERLRLKVSELVSRLKG